MIRSMTGFGRAMAQSDEYQITVEMKAVNHRFLETSVRIPRQLTSQEDALKKLLQKYFSRGKIDVFVTFEQVGAKNAVIKVDKELAIAYHKALSELAECCGLPCDISLTQLAAASGALRVESAADDEERLTCLLLQAAAEAAAALSRMREQEGAALGSDLEERLGTLERLISEISAFAPQVVREQQQKLQQRIAELLENIAVDEARLANEIAFFADKVDISEELTRFGSHIQQFRTSLTSAEPVGRKLEFIQQEMLREVNTIGSKSNALDINKRVIEAKSELEMIREQIQNIE